MSPILDTPSQARVPGVPARNAIIASYGASLAAVLGCDAVALALVKEDGGEYPDADEVFVELAKRLLSHSTNGSVELLAPFVTWPKARLVRYLRDSGINPADTMSCYEPLQQEPGRWVHCGSCHSCLLRRAAFGESTIPDETEYAIR
jgi:7-cyano-7-deazaguanine synthase